MFALLSKVPVDQSRTMAIGSVAVLVILLVVVVVLLLRAIRRETLARSASEKKSPAGPVLPIELSGLAAEQGDADLTRMKAFTPDLLPKLSFDEPGEGDEEPAIEDSFPNLRYEPDAELGTDEPTAVRDLIVVASAGNTDRGRKRTRNEDACLMDADLDLYIVADGMGGYAGGDVAANTAVAEVRGAIKAGTAVETPAAWPSSGRQLVGAIERANRIVHDIGLKSTGLQGMGTTLVTARFAKRKQRLYVAYVGDSRLYRLRAGKLSQLTVDHTLGARGVTGPLASTVRRAVGVAPTVKVDLLVDKPLEDDVYVMCSDGMYKMVSEAELTRVLTKKPSALTKSDLTGMVDALIAAANEAGGKDNITIVLIGVRNAAA